MSELVEWVLQLFRRQRWFLISLMILNAHDCPANGAAMLSRWTSRFTNNEQKLRVHCSKSVYSANTGDLTDSTKRQNTLFAQKKLILKLQAKTKEKKIIQEEIAFVED